MKKAATLSVILLLCSAAFSQNYIPMNLNDGQWNYNRYFGNFVCQEFSYRLTNDTVIGAQTYSKVYRTGVNYRSNVYFQCDHQTVESTFDSLAILIRNDTPNKKVYIYDTTYQRERILFDFDLEVGDTLRHTYFKVNGFRVDSISIDSLAGKNRKSFHLYPDSLSNNQPPTILIEGIGFVDGSLEELSSMVTAIYLLCYKEGTAVYPKNKSCNIVTSTSEYNLKSKHITLYPNPTSGTVRIENAENLRHISVYNLQGQKVQEINPKKRSWELPKENGLYFIRLEDKAGNFYSRKVVKH